MTAEPLEIRERANGVTLLVCANEAIALGDDAHSADMRAAFRTGSAALLDPRLAPGVLLKGCMVFCQSRENLPQAVAHLMPEHMKKLRAALLATGGAAHLPAPDAAQLHREVFAAEPQYRPLAEHLAQTLSWMHEDIGARRFARLSDTHPRGANSRLHSDAGIGIVAVPLAGTGIILHVGGNNFPAPPLSYVVLRDLKHKGPSPGAAQSLATRAEGHGRATRWDTALKYLPDAARSLMFGAARQDVTARLTRAPEKPVERLQFLGYHVPKAAQAQSG